VSFHYLREAKQRGFTRQTVTLKELKKASTGIRAIEHSVSNDDEVVQGYCLAVRSALTDDGRPPLDASGLQLQND